MNLVTGSADALIQRAKSEGEFSPVDLLIMADAGRLYRAKEMGITQAMNIDMTALPEGFYDPEEHWMALTKRARTIMYKKDDQGKLPASMTDLASPEFNDQICVRSSNNIYNQSLVASMILDKGVKATSTWVDGIVDNMARTPKGGDRDQIKAMVAGECRFAIANTYYLGGMLASNDANERQIADQVAVIWTSKDAGGTHVNISGVALAKYAKNIENAQKLIAFMLQKEQQQWYSEVNQEYPVIEGVQWSNILQGFGAFDSQQVDFNQMGKLNGDALKIMDKAGWQ